MKETGKFQWIVILLVLGSIIACKREGQEASH